MTGALSDVSETTEIKIAVGNARLESSLQQRSLRISTST